MTEEMFELELSKLRQNIISVVNGKDFLMTFEAMFQVLNVITEVYMLNIKDNDHKAMVVDSLNEAIQDLVKKINNTFYTVH